MGWLTERQVGRGRIPAGAYKQACRHSIGPLPSIGLPRNITYTFPTRGRIAHSYLGALNGELVGPSRASCPFPPLSNSPSRQLNTIKKCIWNIPDPFTLVIITTNVSPGPSQCIDIDIIDSTPQRSVYLSKKDINAETRFAVTPRRGRGLCVL